MKKEEISDLQLTTKKPKRILSGMKNKQDRNTVGKIALDLKNEYKADDVAPVDDIGKNMTKSTMDELWITVDRGRQALTGSFYVVILKNKEKLLDNVIRARFHYRESAPTPTYLQSVFFYDRKEDALQYLWSIPTKQRCFYMYNYKQFVPIEEYELLRFVSDFVEGKLDRLVQKLNNEPVLDPLSSVF